MISEKLKTFQEFFESNITIGTAHRFQGDEKDIIVFSPAVSEGVKPGTLHWIQATNQLLNVAVTRARSLLVIVGDHDICSRTKGPLKDLVEYVETKTIISNTFDSTSKKMLYEALKKQSIYVTPCYWIKQNPPYQLDFALFVNGRRYALEINNDNTPAYRETEQRMRDKHLREDGWCIRRFHEHDIYNNLSQVIEDIKRLC